MHRSILVAIAILLAAGVVSSSAAEPPAKKGSSKSTAKKAPPKSLKEKPASAKEGERVAAKTRGSATGGSATDGSATGGNAIDKARRADKEAAIDAESSTSPGDETADSTTRSATDFEIVSLVPSLGPFGPRRETDVFFAGEALSYRFDIDRPKFDAERQFNVAFTYRLLDEDGKSQLAESYPVEGRFWIDVERVRYHLEFKLPDDLAPGIYTLELSCIDNEAGRQATITRPLEVKPAEFALVSTRFYYDAAKSIPAPAGGLLGQDLHFQVEVLGEDRTAGKAHLAFEIHVLDEAGNDLSHLEPIAWQHDSPEFVDDRSKHPLFSGHLSLLRAGDFVLRLMVTDKATEKTTQIELPLRIAHAPE